MRMSRRRFGRALGAVATVGLGALGVDRIVASDLAVGDLAPDFTLVGSDGREHRLADHRGKRAVVLAWFPKAFTGG